VGEVLLRVEKALQVVLRDNKDLEARHWLLRDQNGVKKQDKKAKVHRQTTGSDTEEDQGEAFEGRVVAKMPLHRD
jgi:hypothetical protein